MKAYLLLTLILLQGCASATQMMLPSGENGYVIKCFNNKTQCYNKAAEVCPSGYSVADQNKSYTHGLYAGGIDQTDIEMLIKCK